MTFSICGRCATSGMLGVAITTSSICVGSRCPWVRAGVGAVSTQNVTLPSIGATVLDAMEQGADSKTAMDKTLCGQAFSEYRQVIAIDSTGVCAVFSGAKTLGTNATATGKNCVVAGNLLAGESLAATMTQRFAANAALSLPERLLCALEAGLYDAGGEMGDVHSAALLAAHKHPWPVVICALIGMIQTRFALYAVCGRLMNRKWKIMSRERLIRLPPRVTACRETNKSPHSHHAPPRLHGRHRHGNALSPLG